VIAFEDVESLLQVLTEQRVLLLKQVEKAPASISNLAKRLKRDRSAVTRDVQVLESCGVLHVTTKPLPGHWTAEVDCSRGSGHPLDRADLARIRMVR